MTKANILLYSQKGISYMVKTGDLKFIQELNRSIILNTIRQHGPISRSDIAKKIGVSPTTVTAAVHELIQQGLVIEDGTGESSGGRKPILLKFAPDSKQILAVSITNTDITVGEVNLGAEVKRKSTYTFADFREQNVIDYTVQAIRQFKDECEEGRAWIGISVIAPGIVDTKKGVIRYNSRLNLHDVPLKAVLEEAFGIEVWIDNDVNALVLAEKKFGGYDHVENMIYVKLGDGVGAGMIVNGEIYRGLSGGAGEFGHMSIDRAGIRCECGNRGCIDTYINWPAVYSRVVMDLTRGKPSIMTEWINGDYSKLTPELLNRAILNGDHLAMEVMEDVARYLANGLINLINLMNPSVIVIGGEVFQGNERFRSYVHALISDHSMSLFSEDLQLVFTSFGRDFELIGAAAVMLQDIFRSPLPR